MKKSLGVWVRAALLAVAASVSFLAYSAPGGNNPITNLYSVFFVSCDASYACTGFVADIYKNNDGVPEGSVSASWHDASYSNFFNVTCIGPEYADVVSVNQGNGHTQVLATLDESNPGCFSYSETPQPVFTVNVLGDPNGLSHESITGIRSYSSVGTATARSNYQEDCYSESYSGTITPFSATTFDGYSCTTHTTERY